MTDARPRLSVAIIARDEQQTIGACLESVRWADEIVVLDSGSTDATVEICRAYGARVEVTDWPGFGRQKNRALERVQGEWTLSLDADERVSPMLRAEIEARLRDPGDYAGFRMPRASSYLGHRIRHSGWWPDYVTRLVRRDRGRFTDDPVHERLLIDGKVGTLKEPLEHEAFTSLEEVLDKINRYSSLGAARAHGAGRRGSLAKAIGHGLWTFVRTYFLRLGILDGRAGFMLAVSNAEGAYYRYLKLMLLSRTKDRVRR